MINTVLLQSEFRKQNTSLIDQDSTDEQICEIGLSKQIPSECKIALVRQSTRLTIERIGMVMAGPLISNIY